MSGNVTNGTTLPYIVAMRPSARLRPLLALGLVVAGATGAAACSGPGARLQGRWVGDSVAKFAEADVPVVTAWARGVSFEFHDDEVTVTIPAETPRRGTFEVIEHDEDALTVAIGQGESRPRSARFRVAAKRLYWQVGADREVVLERAQD